LREAKPREKLQVRTTITARVYEAVSSSNSSLLNLANPLLQVLFYIKEKCNKNLKDRKRTIF
jgi:hypothetical protein